MNRTCILCGCLCLTGLRIDGHMLCNGCEAELLALEPRPLPALLKLYENIPEAQSTVSHAATE